VATFAYRIIVVLNNYSLFWAQVAWYVGTIGFILYFAHRYQISEKRASLIKKLSLDKKIIEAGNLDNTEKQAVGYIFTTLTSSKEKWNYIFIFVISVIALVWGVYLDFF